MTLTKVTLPGSAHLLAPKNSSYSYSMMENSTERENHTKIVKHQVIVDSNNWKDVDRKLSLPGSQTKQEKGRSLWTRDDQQAFGRFHGPRIEDSESRISGSRWLEAIGRISKFYVHEPWRERAVTCSRQTNRLNNKWRFITKQLINDYWTVDWWTNQSVRNKHRRTRDMLLKKPKLQQLYPTTLYWCPWERS